MLRAVKRRASAAIEHLRLPAAARAEIRADRRGLPEVDPANPAALEACLQWVRQAQDRSATADDGVARHFGLVKGWSESYPETTGYLVPTILDCARRFDDEGLEARARRMLDWLVSIQFPDGGFQGGMVDQVPVVPVTFNTGQILIGLAAEGARYGEPYLEPVRRAADWLVRTQDPDGCWRRHATPFAKSGEKSYETHVAWGLMEAARVEGRPDWRASALRNVDWALGHQLENGWFDRCGFVDSQHPTAHTFGYALRGLVEAWRLTSDQRYLFAARRTADGRLSAQRSDGALPGQLDRDWNAYVPWTCLTGNVQVAACWFLLRSAGGDRGYQEAARRVNAFTRRSIRLDGPPGIRGGVKGSFPVDDGYGRLEYLNWAAKFTIDAFLLELGGDILT